MVTSREIATRSAWNMVHMYQHDTLLPIWHFSCFQPGFYMLGWEFGFLEESWTPDIFVALLVMIMCSSFSGVIFFPYLFSHATPTYH